MKNKKIFDVTEMAQINAAITLAEKNTSGEIVPVITAQSSEYSEIKLWLGSLLVGIGTLAGLAAYRLNPWTLELWQLFIMQPVFFVSGYNMGRIHPFIRLFTSKEKQQKLVKMAAQSAFVQYGLTETKDRTGVLIYISLAERIVVILGDKGIHSHVGESFWATETQKIREGFLSNQHANALARVIQEIGGKLALHFPKKPDDQNEIPDQLHIE